jgi:tripartite-type tricarboxylate transporter receptor subunit TctC
MKIFLATLFMVISTVVASATEKTLNIIVGYPPAAAFHTYGLVLSRHITKHLPADYKVTLRNMPGASGVVAINWVYNVADPNSLTIALVNGTVIGLDTLGFKGANYDASKLNYIGSMVKEVAVCHVWHKSNVKNISDARQYEVILGEAANGSKLVQAYNEILKTKFKVVTGYPGSAETFLAIEREEIQGRCGISWTGIKTAKPEWIKDKKLNFILQLGSKRHLDLKDIPTAMELAETQDQKDLMEILGLTWDTGRVLIASPLMPKSTVEMLRKAFDATLKDSEFLLDAEKMKMEINPVAANEIESNVRKMRNASKETLQRAVDILK